MHTLIKNVRLVDYQTDLQADLLIKDGIIQAIGIDLEEEGVEVVDGKGRVLMPGFVDLHVHFRDPGYTYKEDLESGQRAAVAGGYTTVNLMGNTKPIVMTNEIYEDIIERGKALDSIEIQQVMSVTKDLAGEELIDFPNLPASVKYVSDDGKGILSNRLMYEALIAAHKQGIGLMVHAEDPMLSPISYRLAEDVITLRDVYLAGQTGCHVHFCHVSTVESLDAVRQGKAKGWPVTCEVTPHHIYMTDNDYKVHPPIRQEADRQALIQGIKEGTVDALATDHAPHSAEDKEKGSPGMIGLETAFGIAYQVLVEGGHISLSKLSELMSKRPADLLGVPAGRLEVGKRADLVLIDLTQTTEVTEESIQSKSHNTPFLGQSFPGRIEKVWVKGHLKKGEAAC